MFRRFAPAVVVLALAGMACQAVSLLSQVEPSHVPPPQVPLGEMPSLELDEDKVIEMIEGGETWTLHDLINEDDEGDMYEPGVQRYTVDLDSGDLIDLSTGWCARDQDTMEENEKHITGSVSVDGFVIPQDQLTSFGSGLDAGQSNDFPDGLSCYSWDIVATHWPLGTHVVTETWTLDSDLNDGYDDYQAGTYSIEYTITVAK